MKPFRAFLPLLFLSLSALGLTQEEMATLKLMEVPAPDSQTRGRVLEVLGQVQELGPRERQFARDSLQDQNVLIRSAASAILLGDPKGFTPNIENSTFEILQSPDLPPGIGKSLLETLVKKSPTMRTLVNLLIHYPSFPDALRESGRKSVDALLKRPVLSWDLTERPALENSLMKLARRPGKRDKARVLKALQHIGVQNPEHRTELQDKFAERAAIALGIEPQSPFLFHFSLPENRGLSEEDIGAKVREVRNQLSRTSASPREARLALKKAIVEQLFTDNSIVSQALSSELFTLAREGNEMDEALFKRARELLAKKELEAVEYLLARSEHPEKRSFIEFLGRQQRESAAQALLEEMLLPDTEQPQTDLKGHYREVAVALLKTSRHKLKLAELVIHSQSRYGFDAEEMLGAQEVMAESLLRSPDREDRLSGARRLGAAFDLNAATLCHILQAREAYPEDPELKEHLDRAISWLDHLPTLSSYSSPHSPFSQVLPESTLMWYARSQEATPKTREAALRALGKIKNPPDASWFAPLSEDRFAPHDVRAEARKQLLALRKPIETGPSICRLVAAAALFPFSSLRKMAVTVPLAGWGAHFLIAKEIGKHREAPIPDVLHLSLQEILEDSEHLNTNMLAAARELRRSFGTKSEFENYRRFLQTARIELGEPAEDFLRQFGVSHSMLQSDNAMKEAFGAWYLDRSTALDALSAELLKLRLKKRVEAGEAEGMALVDLIYEPLTAVRGK